MTAAPRHRVQRRPVHGVLLLDKPLGLSSNQALQKAKWLLRAEKAGHTGTLDPLATGVLPICLGAATKFSQLHLDADKSYLAVARLGQTTASGDREGPVLRERPVDAAQLTAARLAEVARQFTGAIEQIPPMHSALKHEGRALYEYAREGVELPRQARPVHIHVLNLAPCQADSPWPAIVIEVTCSKGTYVRTLAEDIGEALGCGAHLVSLRRVRTGTFDERACISLDALEALGEAERERCLQPVDALLTGHARIVLGADDAARFLTGLRRRGPWADTARAAVHGPCEGEANLLLGTGHVQGGELIADRLLTPVEIQQTLARQDLLAAPLPPVTS